MGVSVALRLIGLVVGLVGLWLASERAVEYSIKLSKIFGITTFFIGFVLIAISTGLPELGVTIASLWREVPEVALGDIIGSNFLDISLVLGLPAVIFGTLNVKKEDKLPLMLMLLVTSLVMAFIFILGNLKPIHGVILLFLYVIVIWWLWKTKAVKVVSEEDVVEGLAGENKVRKKPFVKKVFILLKLFVSLAFLVLFSRLSVDCGVFVAGYLPISLAEVGATIFAIGTSLPELALSFHAVRRKDYALAFGNSFGSVLEQATLILGTLAIFGSGKKLSTVRFLPVAPLMFVAYAIVAHSLLKKTKVGRQEGLGRKEGFLLLGLFATYITYYFLHSPVKALFAKIWS